MIQIRNFDFEVMQMFTGIIEEVGEVTAIKRGAKSCELSIRGGIIDIFPPGDMPVRCELFGDEIDRMGYFDVLTQRTVEELDTVVIPPANETVVSEEAKKLLKKSKIA